MNKIAFAGLLVLFSVKCFSQGYYSFETGAGKVSSYGNYYTPASEAAYMKMLFKHCYIGGAIDWRYFSFTYADAFPQYTDPNYGYISSINHHSSYLFFSPLIDISIGERQIFHFNVNAGPGIYLDGNETTTYVSNRLPGNIVYNNINTTKDNNKVIYQYGYGFSEYIPTRWNWLIKLSQQWSILGRDLNSPNAYSPGLRSNYVCFTIGISHYYGKLYYY